MGKDPAFLFYPNDYIGGTMGMTFEEKGAYMELLMLQFNRGHMTSHMIGQTIGQLFGQIKDKFKIDENGLYYNKRLDEEIKKRQEYVSSRQNNKSGKNQYTGKRGHMTSHMTDHMIGHMENENENVNRDVYVTSKDKKSAEKRRFTKPSLDDVTAYCIERNNSVNPQKFLDYYEANGWMVGRNKMSNWKAAVRNWEHGKQSEAERIMNL